MNVPSHILIGPDALRNAVRGAGLPFEGDDLPAMLAEICRQVQAFIAEPVALRDPSGRRLAALRAVSNLLEVIRAAAGEPPSPVCLLDARGDVEGGPAPTCYPLLVVPHARPADTAGAVPLLIQPMTWLDAIDDALSSVIGQEWADEAAEEAQLVVQGILTGHVPLGRLQEELTLFEGDLVPWLDVIDETLSWARDALEPSELGRRVGEAHDMVQGILTGHVPIERLLEVVPPEELVYQLEGGVIGDG